MLWSRILHRSKSESSDFSSSLWKPGMQWEFQGVYVTSEIKDTTCGFGSF